jgi:hypothetical protein
MKILSLKTPIPTALAVLLLAGQAVLAQIPSASSRTGLNAAFVKLFGSAGSFSAKVNTRVLDPSQKEVMRMPMDFAVLDNKVRLEINLAQAQGKDFTAATIAALKQAGMDRMISIFRPDEKAKYVIYPGVQSYQIIPMPKDEAETFTKGFKLEKTPLGKETIDGHACVKNKVVVQGDKGPVLEVTTWNAADLKDFPLQIGMRDKENTVLMSFSQVRFASPDAKQFEVPANYGLMK